MRFPPHLLDDIRARLPVSQVVGRKVALKKKGREYAGLSPFKTEKTPSFFVNDQKGFYHCFASGEHGDIFKFLMTTEGLTFFESVERLAQEAGVTLPKPDFQDEVREDERQRLYRLLEASNAFFITSLATPAGTEARRYIERRGLKRATIATFGIGYGPSSKSALKDHLASQGFTVEEMVLSGMLIGGEDIPNPYDRFRNRVMFPIHDAKGRIIAFGGRALDADAPAKYLNSPETPLFHKGHVLFNAHRARSAAHDKNRIIAVEGYMDAVALSEAGFMEAVAPLGTALTEDQVKLLWRMSDEPILCFDGDSAGRKAAFRAVDTALPLLEPGRSLTFAFLPDGLDPDDMIRQQGNDAMEAVLRRARPLADVLFEREWSLGDWSTPERRAGLEKQLRECVSKIADPAIRGHYTHDMAQRLRAKWGQQGRTQTAGGKPFQFQTGARQGSWPNKFNGSQNGGRGGPGQRFANMPPGRPNPSSSLLKSAVVTGEANAVPYREALLLQTLINHPWLIEQHAEAIADMPLTAPALSKLRDSILSAQALDSPLDSALLRAHVAKSGAERVIALVERAVTHKCDKFAKPDAEQAEVADGWCHALAMHNRQVGVRRSLNAAERQWHEDRNDAAFARICELQSELQRLSVVEDQAEGEPARIVS